MRRFILILGALLFTSVGYAQNLQISGGNSYSVALCDNGDVYAWGLNNVDQFGFNSTGQGTNVAGTLYSAAGVTQSTTPVQVFYKRPSDGFISPFRAKLVDAGSGSHTVALGCDDFVYVWGENTCKQGGTGGVVPANCECSSSPQTLGPTRVTCGVATGVNCSGGFLTGVKYVSSANNATYVILNNGDVMAWGENNYGQLGDGTITDRSAPVYVIKDDGTRLTNIVQIEGGDRCAYALDASGNVYSWGLNDGMELGRPQSPAAYAGEVADPSCSGQPDGTDLYSSAAGQVRMNNGSNGLGGPLTGIVQISGGDTHALALAADGSVWSWGGDWGGGGPSGGTCDGCGQLGQGNGYQFTSYASRVNAVGNNVANTPPYLTGAVYIAAGQASSAAVLNTGEVVTWGANGFFMGCPTNQSLPAGVLGNGMGATGGCVFAQGSGSPVYVETSAGARLDGILKISDGDAWYFAQGTSGDWAWGANTNGQIAVAGNANRDYAGPFSLPGCTLGDDCPSKPDLGPDVEHCPIFSQPLTVYEAMSNYDYVWEYSATGTFPAVSGGNYTVPATGVVFNPLVGAANSNDFTANQTTSGMGYYRVIIDDNRASGPGACGPCPVVGDTIQISPLTNPYTVDGCADNSASKARFNVTAPSTAKIKWYTNQNDPVGSELNPLDSNTTITVNFPQTNTDATLPAGCTRALWAEDVSSYKITTGPANAPCAGTTEEAQRTYQKIVVNQALDLDSISFMQGSYGDAAADRFILDVYAHDGATPGAPTGPAIYSSPATDYAAPASGAFERRDMRVNLALPVGTYWIAFRAFAGGQNPIIGYQGCAGGFNYDNTPNPGKLLITGSRHDGNTSTNYGFAFNLKGSVGTDYQCGRILVCVSGTCVLPVEYVSFTAERSGFSALLKWATASEKNSAYFLVEKSVDGVNFEPIEKINAAGNSSAMINYTFTDLHLASGTTYYRLAQYDVDGSVHYSDVRAVSREGIKNVQVVPNPNNGSFAVLIEGLGEGVDVTLTLRNALSQVVYVNSEVTGSRSDVNLQNLAAGIYYLEVQSADGNYITKIVKE